MIKAAPILIASLLVVGCATPQRDAGPAPVVRATPRTAPATPTPAVAPDPAKPAAPARPVTQTYAYRDPATTPDPAPPPPTSADPTPPAPTPAPAQPPTAPTSGATASQQPEQPTPPAVAQVAPSPTPAPPPTVAAPAPSPTPIAPTPPPVAVVAPALAAPTLAPAAAALASQAEQQRQAGDFAGAAASLERALRIAPRESYLWNRLARIRLEQGHAGQAGNLAARSNDLAGDAPTIKQDNWRIIAETKRRAGDMAGATEAERRASGQ
ncbi:MAG: hypothetical protein EOM91_17370 [Sphingobacteriia bacterium]|nr:hypothetical protein [Sphingobacteriia bacterium]NCC40401.1 hypothetical protein [Gammaproteobacteria bacterium]